LEANIGLFGSSHEEWNLNVGYLRRASRFERRFIKNDSVPHSRVAQGETILVFMPRSFQLLLWKLVAPLIPW